MYWLVKLDDLQHVFGHLIYIPTLWIVITGIIAFPAFIATLDDDESTRERALRRIKKATLLCIPMLFLTGVIMLTAALIPSTKQMAAIMIVPKIANNEKVQTIGNRVYDLAVEWMEELKPNKRERVRRSDEG
jgi:Trk-type K+ transport system membrane component